MSKTDSNSRSYKQAAVLRAPHMDGLTWKRSIHAGHSSGLSAPTYSGRELPRQKAAQSLLERLPSAAQALRYEAVLDALGHMGRNVCILEHHDYATAGIPDVFAAVRPLATGGIEVGLALAIDTDPILQACQGKWVDNALVSMFELGINESLSGSHLRCIRLASREVAE